MRLGLHSASSRGEFEDLLHAKAGAFDRILTGTAIALVLGLSAAATPALAQSQSAIEALVPMPEPANVPPPTAADVGGLSAETTGSTVINLPDPPDLPPPEFKDVAAPAAPAAAPAPVAAPSAAPAPAPVVAANPDQPLRDAIRDLVSAKLTRFVDRKAERTAIEAFYSARNYAPLWVANGAASEPAKQAIAHLNAADADGLDPADYPTPVIKAGADPASLAEAELRLSVSALTYARHAQIGRVHFSRVSGDITYNLVPPEPVEVLAKLSTARDAAAALDSYQPPQPAYQRVAQEARGCARTQGRRGSGEDSGRADCSSLSPTRRARRS